MSNTSNKLQTQIRDIIAEELQRRPVVYLQIQVPSTETDPDKLAATIVRVLKDFQKPPELPDSDMPQ